MKGLLETWLENQIKDQKATIKWANAKGETHTVAKTEAIIYKNAFSMCLEKLREYK